MNLKRTNRTLIRMLLLSLMLMVSVTGTAFASSDVNTDSDTDPVDGTYTFTGNGDWYGYTSFLNYDFGDNSISGREYKVTLPQDGRIQIELSTTDPAVFIDVDVLEEGNRTISGDPDWQFGSLNAPISIKKNTRMLKAGTYSVLFHYNRTRSELLYDGVWPPGYHEFYHNLTFVTLSTEEQTALDVEKKIDALPDSSDLSLSDENTVNTVKAAYDSLTSQQKALLTTISTNRLDNCLNAIKALKEAKAAEDAAANNDKSNGDDNSSGSDENGSSSDTTDSGDSVDSMPGAVDPVGEVSNANGTFRVLSEDSKVATLVKAKNKTSVTVPATVKINGNSYKVTRINANAFTGSKIRTVTIGKNVRIIRQNAFKKSNVKTVILKTKHLSKASVKGSLKGSKVKTVSVKITKKASKTNKTYVKKYKKYFTKANAGKKATVK